MTINTDPSTSAPGSAETGGALLTAAGARIEEGSFAIIDAEAGSHDYDPA